MKLSRHLLSLSILLLTAVAIICVLKSTNAPLVRPLVGTWAGGLFGQWSVGNDIVFALSTGYLVSVMFWIIVVLLPDRRRRKILRDNLSKQYWYFKEDVIGILLSAAGGRYDHDLKTELCDYRKFKSYFSEQKHENWYKALNGLQSNPMLLQDLIVEIEILGAEVAYVLNNVAIDDASVFAFFKRLSYHVYRLKNSGVYADDQVRYLSEFIWEILAQWSMIEGQRKEDIVRKMIEQI